jgi:hypothetical protein
MPSVSFLTQISSPRFPFRSEIVAAAEVDPDFHSNGLKPDRAIIFPSEENVDVTDMGSCLLNVCPLKIQRQSPFDRVFTLLLCARISIVSALFPSKICDSYQVLSIVDHSPEYTS